MAKIKCNYCGDILEGDKRGTYISCSCGKCAIDETPYYFRLIGDFGDYEVLEPKETKEEFENDIRKSEQEENGENKEVKS